MLRREESTAGGWRRTPLRLAGRPEARRPTRDPDLGQMPGGVRVPAGRRHGRRRRHTADAALHRCLHTRPHDARRCDHARRLLESGRSRSGSPRTRRAETDGRAPDRHRARAGQRHPLAIAGRAMAPAAAERQRRLRRREDAVLGKRDVYEGTLLVT